MYLITILTFFILCIVCQSSCSSCSHTIPSEKIRELLAQNCDTRISTLYITFISFDYLLNSLCFQTSSKGFSAACSEICYKPQRDQWCPYCAQRGHQFHECSLLARKCYTSSKSYNPFKHKLEFPEKKKKKRKRKAKSSSFVSTIVL